MSRRLRCLLGGHSWRATVAAGGQSVLVSCRRCTAGPDLVPIAAPAALLVSSKTQPRPAATILYDLWAGRPLDQTVTVEVADIFAVALILLGCAVKPGQDAQQLLDISGTAHLDPDRGSA